MSQPDNQNDQAKLPGQCLACGFAQTFEQHRKNLSNIVESHLDEAKNRVTPVYLAYFASTSVVLSRHWRHRGDIPRELAALPRSVWGFIKSTATRKKNQPNKQLNSVALSGKQLELYSVIEVELLDLPGLDKKLQDHIAHYQANFEAQLSDLLDGLPTHQREDVERQLAHHIERMSVPVEGSREALMFLLTGLLGKGLGASGFGSSIATGQAAATAIYTSNLSWWGSLWVSLTGVPAWVGWVGATSGLMATLIIAPFLSPLLEVGINRFRGKKMLLEIIEQVRKRVIKPPNDAVDVLGKLAVYLQLLPDIIHFAAKIKP
ncbi:hypothetical protein GO003_018440 [Methylicorpusculum oleiharenae]|uniref:hypothetical protein n=1 Tax=Methylicorpusculum oleiharenae TaxID=1338687 RepID=UPI001E60BC23|nr:hypothetical protein [Methylicorpusculum oleiharenae]MCD2452370.1 hypothetical protein [Methylicorpusculum oleiharenae]